MIIVRCLILVGRQTRTRDGGARKSGSTIKIKQRFKYRIHRIFDSVKPPGYLHNLNDPKIQTMAQLRVAVRRLLRIGLNLIGIYQWSTFTLGLIALEKSIHKYPYSHSHSHKSWDKAKKIAVKYGHQ